MDLFTQLIKKTIKYFVISNLLLMNSFSCFSQTKKVPDEVQSQIDNYRTNAIKNRNVGDDNSAATYLNKIAFLYWEYFIYDKAVINFKEVLKINQNIGNKSGEKKVLENLAFVYSDMERFDKAIECFTQSHVFYENAGNKKDIAASLSNIALSYNNNGQARKAIKFAEKGLELSKSLNNIKLMRSFYGILHESYGKIGNKKKSTKYFVLYSSMDKHIQQKRFQEREKQNKAKISQITIEKDVAIHEKEVKEEELKYTQDTLEQRQLAIDLLNLENEAKEARIKVKEARIKAKEASLQAERILRYFLVVVFLVVSVFAYYVYRQMKMKKRANAELKILYNDIEKKNIQILDSINYASHIQEAILPVINSINKEIFNSFVFYKPKDIVSGDFYWFSKHEDEIFIAAIDCTGHGVPGAFMSMIGNTLLNEIVNERRIYNPAEVLTQLNEKVVFTLNQGKDQEGFSEDGMDITFCSYNKKDNQIKIALANHTACIFKNGERKIIEGDIFSIGGNIGDFNVEFTNHIINIDTKTTLYMYSDGYQDQFGGHKNKKYMVGKFINTITEMQKEDFSMHHEILEQELINWKGEQSQIDDILVIGLQFLPK